MNRQATNGSSFAGLTAYMISFFVGHTDDGRLKESCGPGAISFSSFQSFGVPQWPASCHPHRTDGSLGTAPAACFSRPICGYTVAAKGARANETPMERQDQTAWTKLHGNLRGVHAGVLEVKR